MYKIYLVSLYHYYRFVFHLYRYMNECNRSRNSMLAGRMRAKLF